MWWTRCKLHTAMDKLQRFQRLACMAITGCMRTTPTAALEAMLGLPPLHLFVKQEAASSAVRLKSLKLWKATTTPHAKILEEAESDLTMLKAVSDKINKQYVFDKKYRIQLHEGNLCEGLNLEDLRIFTDGSKTDTGTGAGVFSEDLNIRISSPLGKLNTVFQAECLGILLAATAILSREVKNHSIRILTDSMSVLQALNNNVFTSSLLYECHLQLMEVCKTNKVILQWIKGHSGSRGNDAADELARRASDLKVFGPEPIVPIPSGQFRSMLRTRTKEQHREYWATHEACRQSKEALPEINCRLAKKLLKLSRPNLRAITSVITGHGHFNKHLFVIGVTDSPLCRGCMEVEETAAHVMIECHAVADYRARYLGAPRSIPEVLQCVNGLLKFLEEIGWLK